MTCDPNTLARQSSCLRCLTDAQLMQVKTYLLCQWLQHVASAPTNLDITVPSNSGNIVLTWTNPIPAGTTNEVWKSTDGTNFALFTTVAGGVATATDATGMAANNVWYWKVRTCTGGSCGPFSSTISAAANYTSANVASISFPTLIRTFANFTAQGLAALTSISLPALRYADTALNFSGNANLTSVNLNSLSNVGGAIDFGSSNSLTALSFPALVSATGTDFFCSNSPALQSLSMPNVVTVPGNFDASICPNLLSFTAPKVVFQNVALNNIQFTGDKLNATSVNQILARGIVSALTQFDFELAGGTNAAPSGQGIADKATLQGQGNTVNTN